MRKCRELISLHFLLLSPFPLHFLILSPLIRSQAARPSQFVQPCLMIKMIVRPDANRWSELLKSIGNFFWDTLCCFCSETNYSPYSWYPPTLRLPVCQRWWSRRRSSSRCSRARLTGSPCTPLWYPSGRQVLARGTHLQALSRYNWSLAIRYVPYIPDQVNHQTRQTPQNNDWYQSKGKGIALAISWLNASCQLRRKMSSTDSKWADGRLQWMDSELLHKDCLSSAHKHCTNSMCNIWITKIKTF